MINNLARIVAIVLSCSSGAISVVGLANIFSGAYWATIVVSGILECAKVITAAWLQIHWHDISRKIAGYLIAALVVLMMITSIGVYGFFSRAHIDQQIRIETGDTSKIPLINGRIQSTEEHIKDIDLQIVAQDATIAAITLRAKTSKQAIDGVEQLRKNKKSRDALRKERDDYQEQLVRHKTDKVLLENNIRKESIDVGALKYIADLIYGKADDAETERAVRWLIIIIISIFDPLAIILIIATTIVSQKKGPYRFVVNKKM